MSILTVENLSKSYGRIQALKNVSFSVPEGTVFGILGPNGSGKTTMLGTIMDILKPTSGSYKLFDEVADRAHRRRIGTLLETPNFYHYLSGVKNLEIAAEIKQHGKEDIRHVFGNGGSYKKKRFKIQHVFFGHETTACHCILLVGQSECVGF